MKGYNDLKREVRKIWDVAVKVMPVVVDELEMTSKKLKQWLCDIGIETKIAELQKTTILYSTGIFQNVLEV